MEHCDFSSVITTIRKYISDDRNINQIDLLYELFASFIDDENSQDFDFDNGLVCRWFNGQAKISPRISSYYMDKWNEKRLAADIEQNVLPLMYDSAMAIQEIYTILIHDSTISEKMKRQLSWNYPCKKTSDEAVFLASVLCFSMERTFVKRDTNTKKLLAVGTLSPILRDFVLNGDVPKPCRYFCGRENEISHLHELLCEKGKVFLQGIAGIGKSELAKAYAKQYRKEYTNILYITYTGELKQDIIDMDFADDLSENTDEERFHKHNRFLRTLKEDTLLIIDNFNTTETQDSLLSVVLKYRCHILFTTRSRFDNYTHMDLTEISDKQTIFHLMECFYSEAETYRVIIEQIMDIVHRHTLAVELSARLLETGILEPRQLLNKLKEEKAGLNATDTIGITKDGKSKKATYYEHIHTLFSLYKLSTMELHIMRNLSLIPFTGIANRLFANWLHLSDLNTVNDLIEKGFVQAQSRRTIALHPMIQEVAIEETKPSVQNCDTLLHSLHEICLRHGEEVSYYRLMFQTIENSINLLKNDEMERYLRFLEDVFPYMEKYQYTSGLELILKKLTELLQDKTVGTTSDRALLLDYRASCENKPEKAIKLEKEAVEMLTEITDDNAHLAANLYANLGSLYRKTGKMQLAKQSMEQGIWILKKFGLEYYHDSIPQITNYGVFLAEMGEFKLALSVLQELANVICEYNSEITMDYAMVQEAMGSICLFSGNVSDGTMHFKKAIAIYEVLFESEPEMIEAKKQEVMEIYAEAGMYIGKNLLQT